MKFESVPGALDALGLSTTEWILVAIIVPVVVGLMVGLEREFALLAALAGVIGVIISQ